MLKISHKCLCCCHCDILRQSLDQVGKCGFQLIDPGNGDRQEQAGAESASGALAAVAGEVGAEGFAWVAAAVAVAVGVATVGSAVAVERVVTSP